MSCVTLLSDFGLQDASAAVAKGILMQYTAASAIVDISHLVTPFHIQQAAYLLLTSYSSFPAGSIHIILLDVFYNKAPKMILAQKGEHFFLAPDNGILSVAFGTKLDNVWQCYELPPAGTFKDWIAAAGKVITQLRNVAPIHYDIYNLQNALNTYQPKVEQNTVECQVIHIDRYENVILNITQEQFEYFRKDRGFRINFMRNEDITELSAHYSNVPVSAKLCRFNSAGYLEIAINQGNAASLFGFRLHKDKHFIYNTIKIYFE